MTDSPVNSFLKTIFRPFEIIAWAMIVTAFITTSYMGRPGTNMDLVYPMLLAAAVYVVFLFHVMLPLGERYPNINRAVIILSLAFPGMYLYLTGLRAETVAVSLLLVTFTGAQMGKRMAYLVSALAALIAMFVFVFRGEMNLAGLVSVFLQYAVYSLCGTLAAHMAKMIQAQTREAEARNRNLSLLLEMNTISSSLDLEASLPALAEKVVRGLSCTFCCIYLLDRDRGELINYGYFPVRRPAESDVRTGRRFPLSALPWLARALGQRQPLVLRQDMPALAMDELEIKALLFENMQSACLAPLWFEAQPLGVLAVGEVRGWEREPFSPSRVDLLAAIAAQISVVINNAQLHQATRRQVEHMAVINQVTRAIASAIEMDDLLELIYDQLSRVISTETYYVGLLDDDRSMVDLRIIYDEGTRFSPSRIPYGSGLVSVVMSEQRPLLIRHMDKEIENLPVRGVIVGHQKVSQSWLGVPILSDGKPTGVLAVASYQRNVFDEEDQALLTTVAGQAAIALDNARHHAEVEEQSRRDSLTGIYNHGYFYRKLHEAAAEAALTGGPVSLIMLDIDHFKGYNDAYGHVKGDEVLRLTVNAIQAHLLPTDFVGRWGGEEFGVALPGTSAAQAGRVAEKIRRTLANINLTDRDGLPISPPTVSQGIATLPLHAHNADLLVDVADRTLYQAKHAGRDQVLVAEDRPARIEVEVKNEGGIRI